MLNKTAPYVCRDFFFNAFYLFSKMFFWMVHDVLQIQALQQDGE